MVHTCDDCHIRYTHTCPNITNACMHIYMTYIITTWCQNKRHLWNISQSVLLILTAGPSYFCRNKWHREHLSKWSHCLYMQVYQAIPFPTPNIFQWLYALCQVFNIIAYTCSRKSLRGPIQFTIFAVLSLENLMIVKSSYWTHNYAYSKFIWCLLTNVKPYHQQQNLFSALKWK